MRKCPRCAYPLDVVRHEQVELDHCRRCGGTFLDPGEAAEILGGVTSPEVWEESSIAKALGPSSLRCPEDGAQLAAYVVRFEDQSVEVDLCEHCRGLWLDAEEGKRLREIILEAGQSVKTDLAGAQEKGKLLAYFFQLLSGFPMEVWNPVRRLPGATLALIGSLFFVFALQMIVNSTGGGRVYDFLVLVPAEIRAGRELWTLLTSTFLHAGFVHILGNVYFLYVFGDNVEDSLGSLRFLIVYFTAGLAGAILQAGLQSDPRIPSLGASGAVSGILGAYLVLFPRVKLYQVLFFFRIRLGVIWYIGLWMAFNLLMALSGAEGVAWMAHIGGFIAGVVIGRRYRLRPLVEVLRQQVGT
jgi:membrane associated rhomboid family serine protease/Zn-finger nucleic acid-binding protein